MRQARRRLVMGVFAVAVVFIIYKLGTRKTSLPSSGTMVHDAKQASHKAKHVISSKGGDEAGVDAQGLAGDEADSLRVLLPDGGVGGGLEDGRTLSMDELGDLGLGDGPLQEIPPHGADGHVYFKAPPPRKGRPKKKADASRDVLEAISAAEGILNMVAPKDHAGHAAKQVAPDAGGPVLNVQVLREGLPGFGKSGQL